MLKGITIKNKYVSTAVDYSTVASYLSTLKEFESTNCSRNHSGQVRSLIEEYVDNINDLLKLKLDASNYSKTFMSKAILIPILNEIVDIGLKTEGFFSFFDKYNTEVKQMYFYGNIDKSFFGKMDMAWGYDSFYKVAEYSFYAFYNLSVIQGKKINCTSLTLFNHIARITNEIDHKSLIERCAKGTEELGELAQAILSYEGVSGCDYKNYGIDHVKEEAVDLLLVAASIFSQAGGTEPELKDLMKFKMKKWETKANSTNMKKIIEMMESGLSNTFNAVMINSHGPFNKTGLILTCVLDNYFSIGFTIFNGTISIYILTKDNTDGFGHENIVLKNYREYDQLAEAIGIVLNSLSNEINDIRNERDAKIEN